MERPLTAQFFVLFSSLGIALCGLQIQCPYSWTARGASNSCYRFFSTKSDWFVANETCYLYGGYLLVINDKTELEWTAARLGEQGNPNLKDVWWIGLQKASSSDEWKWIDNSPLDNAVIQWSPGEPNVFGNAQLECGMLPSSAKLKNDLCTQTHYFACERYLGQVVKCDEQSGWEEVMDGCYKVYTGNKKDDWSGASQVCRLQNSHLVVVNTDKEQGYLKSLADLLRQNIWIGISEMKETGNFQWIDSTPVNQTVNYWNKDDQQPVSMNGYACGYIDRSNAAGSWSTAYDTTDLAYICEKAQGSCMVGMSEFNTSCYRVEKQKSKWSEMRNSCQSYGMDLAIIESREEDEFIAKLLEPVGYPSTAWIGLQETSDKSDEYVWINGRQLKDTGYKSWFHYSSGGDKPNTQVNVKACAYTNGDNSPYHTSVGKRWDVTSCTGRYQFGICQSERGKPFIIPDTDVTHRPEMCLNGWTYYAGNCYYFMDNEATWREAQKLCNSKGKSELVSILSQLEQEFVTANLLGNSWIGLNDRNMEGIWVWSDGRKVSYKHWKSMPPRNMNKNCVKISPDSGNWYHDDCMKKLSFVCKLQAFKDPNPTQLPGTTEVYNRYCGYGWKDNPTTGICYKYFSQKLTWADASEECKFQEPFQKDVHLLTIDSLEEQMFVLGWIQSTISASTNIWIGANDLSTEGGWEWSNGAPFAYINWQVSEPDNDISYNYNEDCGVMNSVSGYWFDMRCGMQSPFICEKKGKFYVPPPTSPPPSQDCITGWMKFKNACYFISHQKAANWTDARNMCMGKKDTADLASIHEHAENVFILGKTKQDIFIGFNDMESPSKWVWSDGTDSTFHKWKYGQPSSNKDEHCAKLYIDPVASYSGYWLSVKCTDSYNYVCKFSFDVCPGGWDYHQGECFYYSSYASYWQGAQQECRKISVQAQLVSIHSQEINDHIADKIVASSWIGYSDIRETGNWKWSDGSPSDYESWMVGEPNSPGLEQCTQMEYSKGSSAHGKWSNDFCKEKKNFVCRIKPTHILGCPTGWQGYGDFCYEVDRGYWTVSWQKSRKICMGRQADLVSVSDKLEQDFLLGLMAESISTTEPACPEGWIMHNERCYYFSGQILNWMGAKTQCEKSGGKLATVFNEEQNTFIRANMQGTSWIGLNDRRKEGQFEWDAKSNASYRNWLVGEPNNGKGQREEDCVEIMNGAAYEQKWNDAYCNLRKNYVCMGDPIMLEEFRWIGLSDQKRLQSFEWSDNTHVTYTNWGDFMPYKHTGDGPMCVYMKVNDGGWYHSNCADTAGFICKKRKILIPISEINNGCSLNQIVHRGSCYEHQSVGRTWKEAEKACVEKGGHLVTIQDRYEQGKMSALISAENRMFWTGLSDTKVTGIWTWSNGEPVTYTNWKQDHPADSSGHCMAFSREFVGLWAATDCNWKLNSICEYPRVGFTNPPLIKPTGDPAALCVEGWLPYSGKCYKVFQASASGDQPLTWGESRMSCRYYGGDLVSISDRDEESFILGQFTLNSDSYWIGLKQNPQSERGYEWSDGTPVSYFDWQVGQPDSHNDRENCVGIDGWDNLWHDFNCGALKDYICEVQAGITPTGTAHPTSAPDVPCSDSDPGWILYEKNCYFFSESYGEDSIKSWHSARTSCISNGGELASIHDFAENNFILRKIGENRRAQWWLGLTALGVDSGYRWSDGSVFNFYNWARGEPNDALNQESCVTMYTNSGFWNDANCAMELMFVCKKSLHPSTGTLPFMTLMPPGNCPTGWNQFASKCYQIIGQEDSEQTNWTLAWRKCQGLGADLVSIHSQDEQDFLSSLLVGYPIGRYSGPWIGLHDQLGENKFVWSDQSEVNYVNWDRGQPNNGNWRYREENCIRMSNNVAQPGKWWDTTCKSEASFICQRKPDPSISTPAPPEKCTGKYASYDNYNGNCFKLFETPDTWQNANVACEAEGAVLITITNSYEQVFLKNYVARLRVDGVWTGMLYQQSTGTFQWIDGWPVYYSNWGEDQPGLPTMDVLCMRFSKDDGYWFMDECKAAKPYVCKYSTALRPTPELIVPGRCPDNSWQDLGVSCYRFEGGRLSWAEANVMCYQLGGNLASIHSKEEMNILTHALTHFGSNYWVGLIQSQAGSFTWSDGTALNYQNWAADEPSGNTGESGSCVEVYNENGQWNDKTCSRKRAYICKADKVPLATQPVEPEGTDALVSQQNTENDGISAGGIFGIICLIFLFLGGGILVFIYIRRHQLITQNSAASFNHAGTSFENVLFSSESEAVRVQAS